MEEFWQRKQSLAIVNAIEVVLAPDGLIQTKALSIQPLVDGYALYDIALDKVYMINLGGTKINSRNDTLRRVWETVHKYLEIKTTAKSASINPCFMKYNFLVSGIISSNMVYATTQEMAVSASSTVNPKF